MGQPLIGGESDYKNPDKVLNLEEEDDDVSFKQCTLSSMVFYLSYVKGQLPL